MSILGILCMWVWLVVVFFIVSRWLLGREYDSRQAYWARYEKNI